VGTFLYENPELGVRFEVDDRFVPGPGTDVSSGLPSEVRTAYLAWGDGEDRQWVLSISFVDPCPEMTPEELAGRIPVHNRAWAETAAERRWTVHREWEMTAVDGRLAMRNEYVSPGTHPDDNASADPADTTASHVQGWVVYVGPRTYQITLGVHPPGDLEAARAVMDLVMRTFEIFAPYP
jgi:hypothetical protein